MTSDPYEPTEQVTPPSIGRPTRIVLLLGCIAAYLVMTYAVALIGALMPPANRLGFYFILPPLPLLLTFDGLGFVHYALGVGAGCLIANTLISRGLSPLAFIFSCIVGVINGAASGYCSWALGG